MFCTGVLNTCQKWENAALKLLEFVVEIFFPHTEEKSHVRQQKIVSLCRGNAYVGAVVRLDKTASVASKQEAVGKQL